MLQNYGPSSPENCNFADEPQVDLDPEPVPEPIAPPMQGELFKELLNNVCVNFQHTLPLVSSQYKI